MTTILCVDDEPSVGTVLEHALKRLGYQPILATSVNDAMRIVEERQVDLIVADYLMPGATGLDLLDRIEQSGLRVPVIIMTGYSSIEHAVESIKKGAIDYLTKPVQIETLEIAILQTLEVIQLRKQNEVYRQEIKRHRTHRAIVGESETMRRLLETITTVAPTRATVLLEGESGTGKELVARAIH
ncbi:MAG: sigma-54-dependent transcriptional regulator, partial [Gemmatimonadales bacterium]